MPLTTELWIKGSLTVLALLLIVWQESRPPAKNRQRSRRAPSLYLLAAFVAILAYFNFGGFHGRSSIHHWEQFHYVLGSKYFPELGYDGLYVASLEAQIETQSDRGITRPIQQSHLRDLRTNDVVLSERLSSHRREVRSRFSTDRWDEFKADNDFFVSQNTPGYLERVRSDHGYNPPPSWTFVARLFSAWLPVGHAGLKFLAWIDPLLLALAMAMIYRAFGGRIACLAIVLLGLGYAWRFDWVGGAFLRQDWLAAWLIGICQLKEKRYGWAGALFSYAAVVRVFPVLFLFPLGIVALRQLLGFGTFEEAEAGRRLPRWALSFSLGFVIVLVTALGAGSLTGRGASAWTEFADNLELHSGTWLTNNVGAENLLLYDGPLMRREAVDFSLPEPWIHVQRTIEARRGSRKIGIWSVAGSLLVLVAAASWRQPPWRAATLGPGVVFALVSMTCYYWAMLTVVPLWGRWSWSRRPDDRPDDRAGVGWNSPTSWVVALSAILYFVHLKTVSFETLYGLMSWALAILFIVWTLPSAWTTFRSASERGSRIPA